MATDKDWDVVRRDPHAPEHQPGWVPDPDWDVEQEFKNKSWCSKHQCWKHECSGLHEKHNDEERHGHDQGRQAAAPGHPEGEPG